MKDFIIVVITIVSGIVFLQIFFSFWGALEKRWRPDKVRDTPESAFKDLRNKRIVLSTRGGGRIEGVYRKTLYFNDGEFGLNAVVFFQIANDDGMNQFVSSAEVESITELPARQAQ
jgi:hypothetical protein